jgi:hypothetical protein
MGMLLLIFIAAEEGVCVLLCTNSLLLLFQLSGHVYQAVA